MAVFMNRMRYMSIIAAFAAAALSCHTSVVSAAEGQAVAAATVSSPVVAKILKANASVKNIESKFTQVKTIKASGRKIASEGTLYFTPDGHLTMRYSKPAGELLVVNGNKFHMNKGGKAMTFDTSKNALMGSLANTLVNCIKGDPETVAAANNAKLAVSETAEGYVVTLTASAAGHRGYSKIVLTYRKSDCVLVKMIMEETVGITNTYEMKDVKKNTSLPSDAFRIPTK